MSGLGLVLWLFSALLGPARTRSPMFDRLQRRNNSHGQTQKVAGSSPGCSAVGQVVHNTHVSLTRQFNLVPVKGDALRLGR